MKAEGYRYGPGLGHLGSGAFRFRSPSGQVLSGCHSGHVNVMSDRVCIGSESGCPISGVRLGMVGSVLRGLSRSKFVTHSTTCHMGSDI